MRVYITGVAGFIGFHLAGRLLRDGHTVDGMDALTAYYDVGLKEARLALLRRHQGFTFEQFALEDATRLEAVMRAARPDIVVHLAAQAGVRYGLENPRSYVESNLVGSFNLLEAARETRPRHLLLASTSSVYGANPAVPFSEEHRADHPLSLYAATKKGMEALGHAYAHLWRLPTTSFRFFTVYGPWGRPDMALFRFVEAALDGRPIDLYNHGRMERDFTYVDDLVEAIVRLAALPPGPAVTDPRAEPGASPEPAVGPEPGFGASPFFRVVNIGNSQPVGLDRFVTAVEAAVGRTLERRMLPMQNGDVPRTWADTALLEQLTGYAPSTPVEDGVRAFVAWFREHYGR